MGDGGKNIWLLPERLRGKLVFISYQKMGHPALVQKKRLCCTPPFWGTSRNHTPYQFWKRIISLFSTGLTPSQPQGGLPHQQTPFLLGGEGCGKEVCRSVSLSYSSRDTFMLMICLFWMCPSLKRLTFDIHTSDCAFFRFNWFGKALMSIIIRFWFT